MSIGSSDQQSVAADKKKSKVRINHYIRAPQVRLVDPDELFLDINGEPDLTKIGVMSREEALDKAEALNLDLVEISPLAKPPVVRIMDYGKFLFDEKKNKKKPKVSKVKEIKLRPVTDDGAYQIKMRQLLEFLADGDKVKITIRFRGREIAHQELGGALLHRIQNDVKDVAVIEQIPKLEGRQLVMVISPAKRSH